MGKPDNNTALREQVMNLAEETPTIVTKMDGKDYDYILVDPNELLALFQEHSTARVVEELEAVEKANSNYSLDYEYDDESLTHLWYRIKELKDSLRKGKEES